jgi:hypothetical protein
MILHKHIATKLRWLLALALSACAPIQIPNTPEAMACVRECMALENGCRLSSDTLTCSIQTHQCLLTCPGASQ